MTAMPDLPCPDLDGMMLRRLTEFAIADQWGKRATRRTARRRPVAERT
jgi:hypothetical protein